LTDSAPSFAISLSRAASTVSAFERVVVVVMVVSLSGVSARDALLVFDQIT
jgi:hypothetical protein